MGFGHGGLITLMNLYAHPKEFKVGYAGVPVSDLVARKGYHDQGYRDLFSAPYHISKTVGEGVENKVYQDAPGGHQFNRLDTKFARESQAEAYRFLAKHLSPPELVK